MDASVGGIPKPDRSFRPIVITQCVVRCILARGVKRARPELRKDLEAGGQYCLSSVMACITPLFTEVVRCGNEGVPWALTNVDQSNAFGAVSQRALSEAAVALSTVDPELAAMCLRSQCIIGHGGSQEMIMRGSYPAGTHERLSIDKHACGGGQGFPDQT